MLHDWFHEEGGSGFYDIAVKMNKNLQVSIVDVINTQTAALQSTLVIGDSEDALLEEELNPLGRVVVVIAPMAPHDFLARIDIEDVTFVVTGPWKKEGHLNEIAEVVSVAYGRTIIAAQIALQEKGLKRYQKIFDNWSGDADSRPADVPTMVSEMMACAAHQIAHENDTCLQSPALTDEKAAKAVGKMKVKLAKLAVEGAVFSAILPDLLKK